MGRWGVKPARTTRKQAHMRSKKKKKKKTSRKNTRPKWAGPSRKRHFSFFFKQKSSQIKKPPRDLNIQGPMLHREFYHSRPAIGNGLQGRGIFPGLTHTSSTLIHSRVSCRYGYMSHLLVASRTILPKIRQVSILSLQTSKPLLISRSHNVLSTKAETRCYWSS